MSHSFLHQEKRRVRAKLKAKENRIIRNAPTKFFSGGESLGHYSITEIPRSPGWWTRMGARIRSLLHLFSIGPDTRSIGQKIRGGRWFKRQQEKEAHKKQRSEAER